MQVMTVPPPVQQGHTPTLTPTPASAQLPGFARLREVLRLSRRHGIWIVLWSLIGWIGTALSPALIDTPFLLMLLSPRALFVAMASDSVSIVPFVLLGTARLSVTDASYYIIGKRFPRHTIDRAAMSERPPRRWKRALKATARRGDQLARWCCARRGIAGAFLFFRPNSKYLAIGGAYNVPSWLAGTSATLGTAVYLTAMHVGISAIF